MGNIKQQLAVCRHNAFLGGFIFNCEEVENICLKENGCGRKLDEVALVWAPWRMFVCNFASINPVAIKRLWEQAMFFDNMGRYGQKRLRAPDLPSWDGNSETAIEASAASVDALLGQKVDVQGFRTFLYTVPNIILAACYYEALFPSFEIWNELLAGKLTGMEYIKRASA